MFFSDKFRLLKILFLYSLTIGHKPPSNLSPEFTKYNEILNSTNSAITFLPMKSIKMPRLV